MCSLGLPGQPLYQRHDRGSSRRAATASFRVCPLPGDQAAMPAQQRARRHQPVRPQRLRQRAGQSRQDRTIRPRQPPPSSLTAQHRDLATQHQNLQVFGHLASREQGKPADHPAEDQIKKTEHHRRRGCTMRARRRGTFVPGEPGVSGERWTVASGTSEEVRPSNLRWRSEIRQKLRRNGREFKRGVYPHGVLRHLDRAI
jgi:hypothetical protein